MHLYWSVTITQLKLYFILFLQDDLRKDARLMEFNSLVNKVCKTPQWP